MGLLDVLGGIAGSMADDMIKKADRYRNGYEDGSGRAANMSNAELRDSLIRAKNSKITDMKDVGKVRAMADEYKSRKK